MSRHDLAPLLDRLDRIAAALEALAPVPTVDPVLAALAGAYGDQSFTASSAFRLAGEQRMGAEASGLRTPDLPHELDRAQLANAHALGRYLGKLEGRGVVRQGSDRDGVIWGLVVSRGDETASPIRHRARNG